MSDCFLNVDVPEECQVCGKGPDQSDSFLIVKKRQSREFDFGHVLTIPWIHRAHLN